jgi:hypothetical protein
MELHLALAPFCAATGLFIGIIDKTTAATVIAKLFTGTPKSGMASLPQCHLSQTGATVLAFPALLCQLGMAIWGWIMKWLFWIFATLFAIALFVMLAGTNGWFGQEPDALSGIFLVPLGLPWNILAERMGLTAGGGAVAIVTGIVSPLINLAIIYWLWKR